MTFVLALLTIATISMTIQLVYGLIQRFKRPDLAILDGCDSCQDECNCIKPFRSK